MSNRSPDYQSPGPLSVGNVISAAARIYRDRFAIYYKLALVASFWFLVPIYGWAKFMEISGLLSRLAYGEVSGRPESVTEARRYVNPRLWTFFLTALLVGLIFLGWYLLFVIVSLIIGFVLATLSSQNNVWFLILLFGLLGIVGLIAFIISLFWLSSRLYLAELAIAIENQSSAGKAINRSWQLTKQFIWRIVLITFVAFLIVIPVSIAFQLIDTLMRVIIGTFFSQDSVIFGVVYFPLYVIISFTMSATLIPFWQAIKAVIYYDLRIRREGIDIKLRDSI